MDSTNQMHELKKKMEKEVGENILPFWMTTVIDKENGGFYGEIQNDLTINREAPKCLILNTRLIWTYSAAYRIFKDPRYLETVGCQGDGVIDTPL